MACIILPQFPITALREIKILQLLKHENVVNLIEICRTKGKMTTQVVQWEATPTTDKEALLEWFL